MQQCSFVCFFVRVYLPEEFSCSTKRTCCFMNRKLNWKLFYQKDVRVYRELVLPECVLFFARLRESNFLLEDFRQEFWLCTFLKKADSSVVCGIASCSKTVLCVSYCLDLDKKIFFTFLAYSTPFSMFCVFIVSISLLIFPFTSLYSLYVINFLDQNVL